MKQTLFLKCSGHLFIGAIPKFNFKFLIEFFLWQLCSLKITRFGEQKSPEILSLTQGFNKADRIY